LVIFDKSAYRFLILLSRKVAIGINFDDVQNIGLKYQEKIKLAVKNPHYGVRVSVSEKRQWYLLALVGPLAVAVEAAREALGTRAVLALPAGQTHEGALRAAGVVSELVVARLAQHLAPVAKVVGAAGHAVLVVQRRVAVREHGRRVRRAHVHALLLRVPRQQSTLTCSTHKGDKIPINIKRTIKDFLEGRKHCPRVTRPFSIVSLINL